MDGGLEEAAAMLKVLTKDVPGEVAGVDDLSIEERTFLLVTCCAHVIEHTLFATSGRSTTRALEGLDKLVAGMRDNIKKNVHAGG